MRSLIFVVLICQFLACSGGGGPVVSLPTGPILRGPQIAQAQESSIVVAWRSDVPVVGAITCSSGLRLVDDAPSTEHVFTLTGLDADTRYDYALEHDDVVVSDGHWLWTAPRDGSGSVRFAVIGDCGADSDAQREVAAGMVLSDPDLVLITGDIVYPHGEEEKLDSAYFVPYRELIQCIPFYPAIGNHDVRTDNGDPILNSVYLPRNPVDGSERCYSFDRGPVHFVALNSTQDLSPGTLQGDWLADDLAANTQAWTVIYLHYPPYSSSDHGSDLTVRAALVPLCDRYGVDIVFTGHDHVYERTHPLADSVVVDSDPNGDYVDPAGTVFVVTGGGGKSLYTAGWSEFTAASVAAYHHVVVDIADDVLELQAIDRQGVVLDSMTLTKGP
ncbi:MAG: metallophosphoesterase [Planctomycetota bacterium]